MNADTVMTAVTGGVLAGSGGVLVASMVADLRPQGRPGVRSHRRPSLPARAVELAGSLTARYRQSPGGRHRRDERPQTGATQSSPWFTPTTPQQAPPADPPPTWTPTQQQTSTGTDTPTLIIPRIPGGRQ